MPLTSNRNTNRNPRRNAKRKSQKTVSRHRRRPRVESLEHRRVLADLGIDIVFFPQPEVGSEIRDTILRGESFAVRVEVQDVRDAVPGERPAGTPAGVIGLPLN